MTLFRRGLASAVLLASVTLAACGSPATPLPTAMVSAAPPAPSATPEPRPTTPPATATATVAPSPSPQPAAPSYQPPPGWQLQANDQLSIALPPGWRAVGLGGADAQSLYDGLTKNDPLLAGIIGSPETLQEAALWAFGPEPGNASGSAFIDNLNIRRSPLGARRLTGLQQVLDVLLPEYEKMGLKVTSTDTALRVNELAAARVTYNLAMSTSGGMPVEIRGRQYLVAGDADLWVLSFSTVPEREGRVAAEFETSANSFRPK
jgi:hypothetical protein